MTECPVFTDVTADLQFLTADNIDDLVPNVFTRTIGTVVSVSCRDRYQLNGQSSFTCMSNGQWSYPTKPTCTQRVTATPAPDSDIDDDTKILIGVVCGLAALIVIVLIAMIIAVRLKDKRRQRRNDELRRTMVMNDRPDRRRFRSRGHDDISTVDGDVYSRGSAPPPPYRYNDWNQPSRSYRPDYSKTSERSGPMYLPRSKTNYEDNYTHLKDSRKRPKSLDEEFEKKGSRPYVRDWMRRTSTEREDYSRPNVHGRGGSNDSQLWRQAY